MDIEGFVFADGAFVQSQMTRHRRIVRIRTNRVIRAFVLFVREKNPQAYFETYSIAEG